MPEGAKMIDAEVLNSVLLDFQKAIQIDPLAALNMNEIGKDLYEAKLFGAAASVFELSANNPESNNFLIDNFYLGNSIYYNNTYQGAKVDKVMLQKADTAFGNVITASPETFDAIIFRARTNKLMESDDMMAKYYQEYIDAITAKGPEEVTKNKAKLVEAYNNIASHFANFDKPKAKEFLNKTLAVDPTNAYALEAIKLLK